MWIFFLFCFHCKEKLSIASNTYEYRRGKLACGSVGEHLLTVRGALGLPPAPQNGKRVEN